jgi:DNA-binding SARP family transcriptional activator
MSVPLVLHLYGPVRVTHHGQVLPLGGPRECSVLGALAMAPGRPVSVERLIAWLWGEAPPARARKSVQNAVMLLRRALAPVGIAVERAGAAYLLRLGDCVLDTADPGPGEPLEQAGEGEAVDAARARLAELRLAAMERQLAQRLVFEPRDVASELEALTIEHPYREPLWALLMQAHYRAGRQHEALRAYQHVRDVLRDGLGIDPGPVLRDLHRSILAQDPVAPADHTALARAWLGNGAAQAALGDVPAARAAFEHALESARLAADDLLFADAAAALGGDAGWLLGDAATEALLEEALHRLGDPPRDRLRAGRLNTGLAMARSVRGDPRTRGHAAAAVRLTDTGAPAAIRTAALCAQAIAWEGPDDIDARARHGAALLEHGEASGDVVASAMGHLYLGWTALERGDGAVAAAARQTMLALAADSPHPHLAAQVADTRFLDAIVAGRLAEATELAAAIGPAWRRSADPGFAWFLDLFARVFVHELTDGLDLMIPEFEYGSSVAPDDPLWPMTMALAHALAGRITDAHTALEPVPASAWRTFPRSTLWTGYVSGLGWLADLCDRTDLAAVTLELLAPLTARHLVLGAMHYRGAVAHWQGVCHRVLGDLDTAEQHLRQALRDHEELHCPPWTALSAAALARVLIRAAPNPAEATALLDRARHIAADHGMTTLTDRCANYT